MSQKRQPEEPPATATTSEEKRLKIPTFKQVVTEVVKKHNLQKFLSVLEPLVRILVK